MKLRRNKDIQNELEPIQEFNGEEVDEVNDNFEEYAEEYVGNDENELELRSNPEVWEEIDNLERETVVETLDKKNKKNKKDKSKTVKSKKNNGFKKLFFGVGKEFERVTWTTRKELASSFLITLVVVAFFAIIFTLISLAMNSNL